MPKVRAFRARKKRSEGLKGHWREELTGIQQSIIKEGQCNSPREVSKKTENYGVKIITEFARMTASGLGEKKAASD